MKKDEFYKCISEPTMENFADLIKNYSFETDNLDFKEIWIDKGQLAKEMLAIANSGGGIIIFGVKQKEDGLTEPCGISEIKDPANVDNSVKKYIPSTLSYRIETFNYNRSEYEKLEGKNFQVIIIENTPEYLPFVSISEGTDLKKSAIYVRHGTKCVQADNDDIEKLLNIRIQTGYVSKLDLEEHIRQLEKLYEKNMLAIFPFNRACNPNFYIYI